jgi:hypothetical protein
MLTRRQLQKGASDARSEDVRRITAFIAQCINEDCDKKKPDLQVFDHTPSITLPATEEGGEAVVVQQKAPILHPTDRNMRGLPHDVTGGLLSSTSADWSDTKFVFVISTASC